jgi:chorismate mutase
MQGKYLIVDKALLPSYCEKVSLAKELLDEGKAADVSEAVRMVGISRSTFYKYRDMIRDISTVSMGRHAIISMMMRHSVGTLSSVLNIISRYGYSVWTITQNPPVDSKANVVITLELGEDPKKLDSMLREITDTPGLSRVQLLGMD